MLKKISRLKAFSIFRAVWHLLGLFELKVKLSLLLLIPLMLLNTFVDLIAVGVIPFLVSLLVDPDISRKLPLFGDKVAEFSLMLGKEKTLIYGLGLVMLIYLMKGAYNIFYQYAFARKCRSLQVSLINRIFSAYQEAPMEYLLQENSSNIHRVIFFEVKRVFDTVLVGSIQIFTTLLTSVFLFTSLFLVDFKLSVFAFLILGTLIPIYGFGINRYTHKLGTIAFRLQGDLVRNINEGLHCYKESKTMGYGAYFANRVHTSSYDFAKSDLKKALVDFTITPLFEIVGLAAFSFIIFYQVFVLKLEIEKLIPTLSLFAIALVRLRNFFSKILSQINQITYRIHSTFKIIGITNSLESLNEKHQKDKIHEYSFTDKIQLDHISYHYPNYKNKPAVVDVSFKISKGDKVAIIGSTGSGKTTIIDIILGLLVPQKGSCTLDGKPVHQIKNLHQHVAYVPQNIYMQDDTIRSIVATGVAPEDIDDQKVWEALEMAQLANTVKGFPKQLDHLVGENGKRISGGQKQRLGIARALYKRPDILVMDEGTSALDDKTELRVSEVINKMSSDITVILISHRQSSIDKMKYSIKIENGNIVDSNVP